jgi:hypothetical protein
MLGYVAYRLITDKSDGSPPHPLHPLVSNPTDRGLPRRGAWFEWIASACLLLGLSGLLVILGTETGLLPAVPNISIIAGSAALVGLAFLAAARARGKK